jgi:hypothetical protein
MILSDAPACKGPEFVEAAAAAATTPFAQGFPLLRLLSTREKYLLFARSPAYVKTMLITCGSRLVAASTVVLDIVLTGDE